MTTTTYSPPAQAVSNVQTVRNVLKYTYGLVPIVAGADKFANMLTHWTDYLKGVQNILPVPASTFMMIVGVIEIIAGILVLRFTQAGAWIVAAWLTGIAIVLIAGGFYDIAVRDLVMAIGAFCLAKLYEKGPQAAR